MRDLYNEQLKSVFGFGTQYVDINVQQQKH